MKPILRGQTAARNACTIQNDAAISVAQPLNERAADCANGVAEQLEKFGVPKKRQHFVNSARATATARPGREVRIENLAPDAWQPRHMCSMTMDRALREMEFPSRLAGAEWVLGD